MNSFIKWQCNAEFLIVWMQSFEAENSVPISFSRPFSTKNILHNLDMKRLERGTDRFELGFLLGNPDIERHFVKLSSSVVIGMFSIFLKLFICKGRKKLKTNIYETYDFN